MLTRFARLLAGKQSALRQGFQTVIWVRAIETQEDRNRRLGRVYE